MQHEYHDDRPAFTIGIEEEFQILNKDSNLAPIAPEILSLAPEGSSLRAELFRCMIETGTPICEDIKDARKKVIECRQEVYEAVKPFGASIAASGTNPCANTWKEPTMPDKRYQGIMDEYRCLAQRNLIFGMHVHVAAPNPNSAIRIHNHLRNYIPLLLALSANSPWWNNIHTGAQSYRSLVFSNFMRSGIPPHLNSWGDWKTMVERAKPFAADASYLWWDVRMHPKYGTVETRVCDMQTNVEHVLEIAALIQALCAEADDYLKDISTTSDLLLQENRWRAARDGMQGTQIKEDGDKISFQEKALETIDRLIPFVKHLGSEKEISALKERVNHGIRSVQDLAPDAQSATKLSIIYPE